MQAWSKIREFQQAVVDWRHDLHIHPEIGFEEKRTSELIARTLAGFGLDVHRNPSLLNMLDRSSISMHLPGEPLTGLTIVRERFQDGQLLSGACAVEKLFNARAPDLVWSSLPYCRFLTDGSRERTRSSLCRR